MATTLQARRTSADDKRPGVESPFRSKSELVRYKAACDMIVKRSRERAEIEIALSRSTDKREQNRLATRLRATVNNLKSWETYLLIYPTEKRAVIVP